MGDWGFTGLCQIVQGVGSTYGGIAVTSNASAHTKGNWSQAISSLVNDINKLHVNAYTQNQEAEFFVDIGIGAEGSEVVLIPNLVIPRLNESTAVPSVYEFPLSIPKGTRISARCQCDITNAYIINLALKCFSSNQSQGLAVVTTYGANTGTTRGVQIDPGGSAGTKGVYSELSASITKACRGFAIGIGSEKNQARTAAGWFLDIAIGAEGSETIIVPDIYLGAYTNSIMILGENLYMDIPIPAGTRMSARANCTTTDATDRLFDVILYGVS